MMSKIDKKAEEKFEKALDKVSSENKDKKSWKTFDLVCGMELDMQNVRFAIEHDGKEYYFCSKMCKSHFVDDPDKYIGEN